MKKTKTDRRTEKKRKNEQTEETGERRPRRGLTQDRMAGDSGHPVCIQYVKVCCYFRMNEAEFFVRESAPTLTMNSPGSATNSRSEL